MRSVVSTIYLGSEWFIRIVKLNVVWLLFSILGVFLFSFFPATYAAFYVARRWTEGDKDIAIWKAFFHAFKIGYWHSQLLGMSMSIVFFIIYVDIQFFRTIESKIVGNIIILLLMVLLAGMIIISFYMFPVKVMFDLNWFNTLKTALFLGLSYIHWTLINTFGIIGILFASYLFPVSIVFLTGGTIVLWITCMAYIIQNKIEENVKRQII